MSLIVIENQTFPLIVDFSGPTAIAVTLAKPAPINCALSAPATIQFEIVPAPVFDIQLGAPAIGIPGPPGPRGSLFLGGYPSAVNLPVPDGVNVRVGDFALVQDESAIYELE